jgi:hypothetical protein
MDTAWVGVIGTLGGVTAGWLGTMASQRFSYRREATERLTAERRVTYLAWMSKVHVMYEAIAMIHREATTGVVEPASAAHQLREASSTDAQTALEDLRLLATDDLAAAAAAMWSHLRRDPVPLGHDLNPAHWRTWRDAYWELRREFLNAARVETGFQPLDWTSASVTVGRPKRF